jgi:ribosome biogenesis protein BMS1
LNSLPVVQMGFRIAATGVVLSQDQTIEVMKKLKLIGEPTEVYRKTAFIKVPRIAGGYLGGLLS